MKIKASELHWLLRVESLVELIIPFVLIEQLFLSEHSFFNLLISSPPLKSVEQFAWPVALRSSSISD